MTMLVGRKAPSIKASAVENGGEFNDQFTLSAFEGKKYVLLFFYPLDFTFVCPTEIIAFQDKLAEFEARNVQVIGCSIDSKFSHWAWLNTPKDKGGIQGVRFPLVADVNKTIAMDYGVLAGNYGYDENDRYVWAGNMGEDAVAYRGLFLIDKEGIVRHQLVNDLPLGRNVDEAIRMVDALQFFETNGEVCPANWSKGKEAMKADAQGVANYLAKH